MGKAPVLYFLHGRGRNHRSLIESEAARSALLAAPCYIVLPQGEDGWYINVPGDPQSRYETYLEEVIAWAEREYPIAPEPAARGIAGWSMGGYGAVRFAETHPGKFGFVASVIGLLDFPRPETLPEGQNYRVPIKRFSTDYSVWATLNPLRHVEKLQGAALTLVLTLNDFSRRAVLSSRHTQLLCTPHNFLCCMHSHPFSNMRIDLVAPTTALQRILQARIL